MQLQAKTFKKDLYRKFLLFSVIPIIILSIIFISLLLKEKYNIILSQHTNIVKNIQYNIDLFIKDIKDISKSLKEDRSKDLLRNILKYKDSIDTIMILNKNGIIESVASKTNKKVFKGYDYSHKSIFKEEK